MAGEAANLTDMRNTRLANAVLHRSAVAVADVADPVGTSFCPNSGLWPRARVYCRFTPVNGTSPTFTVRVWVRKHVAAEEAEQNLIGILMAPASNGLIPPFPILNEFAVTPAASVTGPIEVAFDVPVNGDDIFVQLTDVAGSPDSFAFSCWIGWRP